MGRAVLPLGRVDPRAYIRTAFESGAIEAETCRRLILEWALRLPQDVQPTEAARVLLAEYHGHDAHPMYQLLLKVLADPVAPAQAAQSEEPPQHKDP
ncbi:hypothetical protein [Thioclava sp. GXIMD2076]|uniref:hypothetical protein n=1 Tax=Thioclava sp. GXIMD2076 TaxID=3131931 RepID=UPI0030CB1CC2